MNRKLKIFIKIVYYIFTLGLGVLFAFILPGLLVTIDVPGHIEGYLNNGEYARSVNLLAGFDDKEIAYQKTFEDQSGIVLFRTLVLIPNEEKDAKQADSAHLAYSGFIYNLQGKYQTNKLANNKARIVLNKDEFYELGKGLGDNLTSNVEITSILGYDDNQDGMMDNCLTLVNYNYVYFELLEERTKNISSITFMDADGQDFLVVDGLNLDFTNEFYTSVTPFKDKYNENSNAEELKELQNNFLDLNPNYEKSSQQEELAIASKKGAIIILIYFIAVYVIADFLVGRHFIIQFVKWIIRKIRKKEGKEEEPVLIQSVYGTDYYTQLTIKLKVPEGCKINANVHYHNETDEINMTFSPENNYQATKKTHAGVYLNSWLEAPGYVSENLPKTLAVRGFKMSVEVSLREADKNENSPEENLEKEKEE